MEIAETEPGNMLSENLQKRFGNWKAALAYLLFVVLYSPCMASLAMLFKEHGGIWTFFTFVYLNILAWLMALIFYQIAAFNSSSPYWLSLSAVVLLLIVINLRYIGNKHEHTA
jgi:ferrous iron transport protein B